MSYFSAMMDILDAALDGTGPAAIAATAFATGVVFVTPSPRATIC